MNVKFDYSECLKEYSRREDAAKEQEPPCPITYIIDREKRTVAAYMEHCKYDVFYSISNILKSDFWDMSDLGCLRYDNYMIANTYRGKAKCAPEDAWNVEEGMRIARNRLLEKYWKARHKATHSFMTDLNAVLDNANKLAVYSWNKICTAQRGHL